MNDSNSVYTLLLNYISLQKSNIMTLPSQELAASSSSRFVTADSAFKISVAHIEIIVGSFSSERIKRNSIYKRKNMGCDVLKIYV